MKRKCPTCNDEYKGRGQHYRSSNCGYPEPDETDIDIIEGLLMGDGWLSSRPTNSKLQIRLTNKEFLEWLDSELYEYFMGVRFDRTAEESAENARKYGLRENAEPENYRDVYRLDTHCFPFLNRYNDFQESECQVFPSERELSPEFVKMWYVSDGGLSQVSGKRPYARIRYRKNSENIEEILESFEEVGLEPYLRSDRTGICFTVDETPNFLDWLGEPLPGFEYKWAMEHKEYVKMKELAYK